ncbi:MAG: NUDIX hydrolase [Acidimicrobiales bacterium]
MSAVEVCAAGGVVWRPTDRGVPEVLLVHRPRYRDWSLPKGKLDAGERWAAAALREVEEETGLVCELGAPLVSVFYPDRRRRLKEVRYWAMRPLSGTFAPNKEVDAIAWLDLHTAMARVTYEFDLYVLDSFEDLLTTTIGAHS